MDARKQLLLHLNGCKHRQTEDLTYSDSALLELVNQDHLLIRLGFLTYDSRKTFQKIVKDNSSSLLEEWGLNSLQLFKVLTSLVKEPEVTHEEKEQTIRLWIAKKESVCPYAPGLVKFTHLPEINDLTMENVKLVANELRDFYQSKEAGKRTGRWIILPHREWLNHEDAKAHSELIYWHLLAAYFYLIGDIQKLNHALKRQLKGLARTSTGDIRNPIIGLFSSQSSGKIDPKSLFCTALAPTYSCSKFYRYAPYSAFVLVYTQEFYEKMKYTKAINQMTVDMLRSNIFEVYGEELDISLEDVEKEMPLWEKIIDTLVNRLPTSIYPRDKQSPQCASSFMELFAKVDPAHVHLICTNNMSYLPVMHKIMRAKQVSAYRILNSLFSGAGLYVSPAPLNQIPIINRERCA